MMEITNKKINIVLDNSLICHLKDELVFALRDNIDDNIIKRLRSELRFDPYIEFRSELSYDN